LTPLAIGILVTVEIALLVVVGTATCSLYGELLVVAPSLSRTASVTSYTDAAMAAGGVNVNVAREVVVDAGRVHALFPSWVTDQE
jgi:hypothetical protein